MSMVQRLFQDAIANDSQEIKIDIPLMDAGIDSLSALAVTSQIAKEFGVSPSDTLIFEYPTIRDIHSYLVGELLPDQRHSATSMAGGASTFSDESAIDAALISQD
jgi:acyl carrier protein